MSYTNGEANILTRLQAISGFTSSNTSRANWGILNNGKAAYYAILRPGEFSIEWITVTHYLARYRTVCEVWQKYTTDTDSKTNLYSRVAALLTALQAYPHLGGGQSSTYIDATISGGPEPTENWTSSGGPLWLRWNLNFDWQEEIEVTFAE